MSNDKEHAHHILPLSTYFNVFTALIILTIITVWISFYHFGEFNLLVAMIVAGVKASLVALFFMHLKYENKLLMIIFVSSVLFLAVFIIFTMFDTMTRGEVEIQKEKPINPNAAMYDSLNIGGEGDAGTATDSTVISADSLPSVPDSAKTDTAN